MNKKFTISVAIVSGVVLFVAGMYAGGHMSSKTKLGGFFKGSDTYQKGWDAAKRKLQESNSGALKEAQSLRSNYVRGIIAAVSADVVTLKSVASSDPLSDPSLENRMVRINGQTKVVLITQKDQEQFQKERQEFQSKMLEQVTGSNDTAQQPTPPSIFDLKEISASDLKPGQNVNVRAEGDISNAAEFTATEIDLN
ncbi:MAG TPA: hypothetical protein VF817_02165 [Patescibacteria group bacterium]